MVALCRGRHWSGAAVFLNEKGLSRAAGGAHGFGDAMRLRILAAETHSKHAADVGMRGQRQHQADGVVVVVAAGKADDVRVWLVFGDLLRNEAGALHGVDHQQLIANAFAAIGAEVAGPNPICGAGGNAFRHRRCLPARRCGRRSGRSARRAGCGSCGDAPTRRAQSGAWRCR